MLLCLYSVFWSQRSLYSKPQALFIALYGDRAISTQACPYPFIRFLLVLYHKPTTFSKCETKKKTHNRTASKWACPSQSPHKHPSCSLPSSLWGAPDSLFSLFRGWLCYLCAVTHSIFLHPPLQLTWVFALHSTGKAEFDLLVSLCWYSGSLCHPQPRGMTLILQHCESAIAQHKKIYRGDKLCEKGWSSHAFNPLISAQTFSLSPYNQHNKHWSNPRPQAMNHLL